MRRWRRHPTRRPRGVRPIVLRVGLPLIINLGWGLGLLLLLPRVTYPLQPIMLIVPDLGYLVVASAVIALTWGLLRSVLVYSALRRPLTDPRPGPGGGGR